jgi:hypothetical protein
MERLSVVLHSPGLSQKKPSLCTGLLIHPTIPIFSGCNTPLIHYITAVERIYRHKQLHNTSYGYSTPSEYEQPMLPAPSLLLITLRAGFSSWACSHVKTRPCLDLLLLTLQVTLPLVLAFLLAALAVSPHPTACWKSRER